MIVIPPIDEQLCMEAERLATGARIHDVAAQIGIYRGSIRGAERALEFYKESNSKDDLDLVKERLDTATRYSVILRSFVVNQRLAAI